MRDDTGDAKVTTRKSQNNPTYTIEVSVGGPWPWVACSGIKEKNLKAMMEIVLRSLEIGAAAQRNRTARADTVKFEED